MRSSHGMLNNVCADIVKGRVKWKKILEIIYFIFLS